MHITFTWNDEDGFVVLDADSIQTIDDEFEHSPLTVLDFLLGVHHAVVSEYNDALNGFHHRGAEIIRRANERRH